MVIQAESRWMEKSEFYQTKTSVMAICVLLGIQPMLAVVLSNKRRVWVSEKKRDEVSYPLLHMGLIFLSEKFPIL